MKRKPGLKHLAGAALISTAALLGGIGAAATVPIDVRELQEPQQSNPLETHDEAMQAVEQILQQERDGGVHPEAGTIVMSHGIKTEHSIAILHGGTVYPGQFGQLAQLFFEQGYNVLLLRAPKHGLENRMAGQIDTITAPELLQWGNTAVDIAQGLGENVSVYGFSMGGVVATHLALYRPDIHSVAVQSGAFVPTAVSNPYIRRLATRLTTSGIPSLSPHLFRMWWNQEQKENDPGLHTPYLPYRLLGALSQIAYAIEDETNGPQTNIIIFIDNKEDMGEIDYSVVENIRSKWEKGAHITVVTINDVPHNIPDDHHKTRSILEMIVSLITGTFRR